MAEDIRLYADFFEHPKTQILRQRLGLDGVFALERLWCAAASNWRDGNLAGKSDQLLEMAAHWTGKPGELMHTLREVVFVDGEEFNSRLHNWAKRQPWVVAYGERSDNGRQAARSKWSKLEPAERSAAASKASRARWDRVRAERLEIARKKGTHTKEEWEILLDVCGWRCLDCGADDAPLVKDHVIPIYYTERPDATDAIDNLQPLCDSCNKAKGADPRDKRPPNWREEYALRAARTHMHAPNPTTQLEEETSNALGCKPAMHATRTHADDKMMLFRVQQQLRDQGIVTGKLAEWVREHEITHCNVNGRLVPVVLVEEKAATG